MRLGILALGIGVLAIGLPATGIVSPMWGWILSAVAIALMLIALAPTPWLRRVRAAIPFAESKEDATQSLALTLSEFLQEGNKIHAAVPTNDSDAEAMNAAYENAEGWAKRVVSVLDAQRPGWSSIFLDDTFGAQLFAVNTPRRAGLQNWFERRLTRLRELILRIA